MYCPKCQTSYGVTKIVINFQNLPVEENVDPNYCPVCGYKVKENKDEVLPKL